MGLGLGLVGLLGAPACESQVGDGYEGEVQFLLEGTVHGADSGLRPRIGFIGESDVIFVDGTVTGSFPSKFRFEVTEPAPAEAIADGAPETEYAGKLAIGFIAMMPEGSPDRLPFLSEVTSTDGGCDPSDGSCVWYETACSKGGSCRERTLECEPCEVIGQKGDSAVKDRSGGTSVVWTRTAGYSTGVTTYCDAEMSCYHEYSQCDLTDLGALETTTGVDLCSIVEESGDTALVGWDELQIVASQYFVVYASEPMTTEFATLEQGYNLLQYDVPTLEQMQAAPMNCDSGDDETFCFPELPGPHLVDSFDVSIDLGLPPM